MGHSKVGIHGGKGGGGWWPRVGWRSSSRVMKTQGGVGLAQALRAQQGEEALLVRQSLSRVGTAAPHRGGPQPGCLRLH